jgi:hypothetical protein
MLHKHQGDDLANYLGLESPEKVPPAHGWIVDTSIERDHERFSGFLKLSLEELLIALRDDRSLLSDPQDFLRGLGDSEGHQTAPLSLYPTGFTAKKPTRTIDP